MECTHMAVVLELVGHLRFRRGRAVSIVLDGLGKGATVLPVNEITYRCIEAKTGPHVRHKELTQRLAASPAGSNYGAVAGSECNTVIELRLEHHAASPWLSASPRP